MSQSQNDPSWTTNSAGQFLRKLALEQPGVSQGVACQGTTLECITFSVKNKAFLFLRDTDAKLKLRASLPEAVNWSQSHPTLCKTGASGWVTLSLAQAETPPSQLLQKWVMESYHLLDNNKGRPAKTALANKSNASHHGLPTKKNKQ